jgi:hypothetical protein
MSRNKIAYFQGGGGVEPTPGKKKYKSDPAIVAQPRFVEPFYRNYDLYTIPGMEDIGPGTGWHGLQNYKSVAEFLKARRERLKPRYVADDSWHIDSGKRVKKNPDSQARMSIFEKIIKVAGAECHDSDIKYNDGRDAYYCTKCGHLGFNGPSEPKPTVAQLHSRKDYTQASDENDGPNFDYGDGAYTAMSQGKKMKSITDAPHKSPGAFFADDNDLGYGFYENLEKYKSVGDFIKNTPLGYDHGAKIPPEKERAKHPIQKADDNDIDFPIDDMVNRQDQMIYPEEDEYQIRREKGDEYDFPSDGSPLDPGELNISMTTPQISGEHSYLPNPDFEGKSDNGSQLDFGRDYTEEALPGRQFDFADTDDNHMDLDELESKYLESTETGLFGLPDGVDPEGHDADQTVQVEQPYDTISDISNEMYEDKWNI